MGHPRFEKLSGAINGFNVVFETSAAYAPGSVRVFLNGVLLQKSTAEGFSEAGSNRIKMKEPPRVGEVVQAFYLAQ